MAFGSASSPIHWSDNRFARVADSVEGWILSLGVFSIVGISILLLDSHLFDGRHSRSASSRDVADPGADRRYHRRIDVWTLRKLPLAIVTRLVEREGRSSPRTVRQPRQSSENTFH